MIAQEKQDYQECLNYLKSRCPFVLQMFLGLAKQHLSTVSVATPAAKFLCLNLLWLLARFPFGMHRVLLTRELCSVRPFLSGSCVDPVGVLCWKVTATCYRALCTDKRVLRSSFWDEVAVSVPALRFWFSVMGSSLSFNTNANTPSSHHHCGPQLWVCHGCPST